MENPIPSTAQFVMMTAEQFKSMVKETAEELSQKNNPWDTPAPESLADDDIEDYLSREETAEKLGVNLSTLWRWNKEGYLPCVKIGSKVKYPMSIIRAFIDRNKGRFEK